MKDEQIPIVSWNFEERAWIEPQKELAYHRQYLDIPTSFPDRCIVCYQEPCVRLAVEQFQARRIETMLRCGLHEFEYNGKRIGIIQSGIGGPMAALVLERLIARGMKYFLNVGSAGSLQTQGLAPGDLVLCSQAVRNDGTSYHYLPPSRCCFPDEELTRRVECVLRQEQIPYMKGPTISIDGPYRFVVSKAAELRQEGVLTSEMEASTVFAVSKFRGTQAAAVFTISDLSSEDFKWDPQFHAKELTKGYENLFKVCVETLGSME